MSNIISLYTLVHFKLLHKQQLRGIIKEQQQPISNLPKFMARLFIVIPFRYYNQIFFQNKQVPFLEASTLLEQPSSVLLSSSSMPRYNSFLITIGKLLALPKLNFNNAALYCLLGLVPSSILKKFLTTSTNKFDKAFFNLNYIVPNINAIKFIAKKSITNKHSLKVGLANNYAKFLSSILITFLRVPIGITIINLQSFFIQMNKSKLLTTLVKSNLKFHYRIGAGFFLKEAAQVLLLTLIMKDPIFFMGWFTKIMEKVQFFKHKNYIMFFKSIFTYLNKNMFKKLGIRGLYFDIRGKVAVKGDSKKRHILLRYGECTFSQKSIRVAPSYGLVNTFTGILGVTFILFF